jgi:hypothetical protein
MGTWRTSLGRRLSTLPVAVAQASSLVVSSTAVALVSVQCGNAVGPRHSDGTLAKMQRRYPEAFEKAKEPGEYQPLLLEVDQQPTLLHMDVVRAREALRTQRQADR